MPLGSLLILAVGLAMDATAVAATRGLLADELRPRHFVLVGLFFGGFQGLMPILGWFLGVRLGPAVAAWDHWIAFVLLVGLGAKMIHEARSSGGAGNTEAPRAGEGLFGIRTMTLLALATSLDALAVGITLPMLGAPLLASVMTIAVVTALFSMIGLVAGRRFGARLGSNLDAFGGVVLMLLGTKVLFEHLFAR